MTKLALALLQQLVIKSLALGSLALGGHYSRALLSILIKIASWHNLMLLGCQSISEVTGAPVRG